MFPPERRQVPQIFVGNVGLATDLLDGHLEVAGILQDDGRDQEVQPRGPCALSFERAVAEFAKAVEENSSGERVPGLSLVQSRKGGRRFDLSKAQVRLAQAAMQNRDTKVSDLCEALGVTRSTLYRYVGPHGELREHGERVLGIRQRAAASPRFR